jgi:hypothetical protein
MRKSLLCFAQTLLLIGFAIAQPETRVVDDFGLLGKWAIECGRPPSPMNEHALFSLTSVGIVWVFNDFGPDYDGMVYRVADAKRVGSDKLFLRQVLATDEHIVLDIVMWKSNDRIRIWSSRAADGSTLVRDGTLPSANGQETRWAGRCGERRAVHPGSPLD